MSTCVQTWVGVNKCASLKMYVNIFMNFYTYVSAYI